MPPLLSLPFHRRCLRRTAWVTLVGWLWALTASVVNACALAPSGAAGHDAAIVQFAAAHGVDATGAKDHPKPDDHSRQGWHVGDPSHAPDAGRVSCLKFCDDGSSALAKSTASPLDSGTLAMVLAPTWRPEVSAPVAATWWPGQTPSRPRLPLTIRFRRLTL